MSSRRFGKEHHEFMCQQYLAGDSIAKVAERWNCASSTVQSILEKCGIPRRSPTPAKGNAKKERNDLICCMYRQGKSMAELEMLFDLSESGIRYVLTQNEIPLRTSTPSRIGDAIEAELIAEAAALVKSEGRNVK